MNNPINYVDPSGHLGVKITNAIIGGLLTLLLDYSSAFICYKFATYKNLSFSKFGFKNAALAVASGIAGGLLMSTRYKKKIQVFGASVIAGVKSILSNIKRKVNLKKILKKLVGDVLIAAIIAFICGDGLGSPYWVKGLFGKGSYKYNGIILKYRVHITISSKSLKYTKRVIKETAKCFAYSVIGSITSTVKSILEDKIGKKYGIKIV